MILKVGFRDASSGRQGDVLCVVVTPQGPRLLSVNSATSNDESRLTIDPSDLKYTDGSRIDLSRSRHVEPDGIFFAFMPDPSLKSPVRKIIHGIDTFLNTPVDRLPKRGGTVHLLTIKGNPSVVLSQAIGDSIRFTQKKPITGNSGVLAPEPASYSYQRFTNAAESYGFARGMSKFLGGISSGR